jgi:hypothetical protein
MNGKQKFITSCCLHFVSVNDFSMRLCIVQRTFLVMWISVYEFKRSVLYLKKHTYLILYITTAVYVKNCLNPHFHVAIMPVPVARGLRRRSTAARLLRSWVRIPPGPWMFVCCVCYVLSGRGLCNELITRPEESYWLWCVGVVVCNQEISWTRGP